MKSGPRMVFRYSSSGMRKPYPTDLSDAEWNYIEPDMKTVGPGASMTFGSRREILNAVFYLLKSGWQCRLLPHDFPTDSLPSTITSGLGESTAPGRGFTLLCAIVCECARNAILNPVLA
jgi:hypothetical protein